MRKTVKILLPVLMLALMGAFGLYFFPDSGKLGPAEIRQPASPYMRALDQKDYDAHIEDDREGNHARAIRDKASNAIYDSELIWAAQFVLDTPYLVANALNETPRLGGIAAFESGTPHNLAPIFTQDGSSVPRLYAALPKDYQDALDMEGKPLRWFLPEHRLAGYSVLPPPRPAPKVEERPAFPELARLSPSARAGHYRELVEGFARKYNLNANLIMAIIHSESDFSPSLVSNKSAMGLMQLLPSTASDEVHRFLYGRRGQVSFEELRIPEINIRYGTAYLHILLNRYFSNVRNRDVQEACVIAAYNLGPNRFLRLYGSTNENAVEHINNMAEDEFYLDLARRLPARETRYFVEKVRRMKNHYSGLSQAASN